MCGVTMSAAGTAYYQDTGRLKAAAWHAREAYPGPAGRVLSEFILSRLPADRSQATPVGLNAQLVDQVLPSSAPATPRSAVRRCAGS